jgi:hypothetical protein
MMTFNNTAGARALKDIVRAPFAWPGGYEKFAVADDGGVLCWKCCTSEFKNMLHSTLGEYRDGWHVEHVGCAVEIDGPITCDHCSNEITA